MFGGGGGGAGGGGGGGGGSGNAVINISSGKRKTMEPQQGEYRNRNHLTQLLSTLTSTTSSAYSFLLQNDVVLLPSQTLTLESQISSVSLSLSTLLSLLPNPKSLQPIFVAPPPPPPPPTPQPPQQCWFQRFLSDASADYDSRWVDAFHMSKPSFTLLLRLLSPSLQASMPSLPPNYTLAAALFRLAHGASYRSVGRRFGLDSAGACRAFYVVCKVVNDKLGHMFEFRSDIGRIVVGFGWISLPNCCGVLGFGKFGVDGELLGKDGALMVQALVDSEGRFLDVSAGWSSKLKPDTILHQSALFSSVDESRELLNGPPFELTDGNLIPQYILGDSCLPLLPWLLTPYVRSSEEDSLSSSEQAFNFVHSRGMGLVSTAFCRVRARWQLLAKRWKEECIEFFPFVIVTGCLLHNFLIKCSEPLPDENAGRSKDGELPIYQGKMNESGQRIRDALASHLSRASLRYPAVQLLMVKVLPVKTWSAGNRWIFTGSQG